jgi:hypothetical protein
MYDQMPSGNKKNTHLKTFFAAEWPDNFVRRWQHATLPHPLFRSLQYILQDDHRSILLFPKFFKLLVEANLFFKLYTNSEINPLFFL